MNLKFVQKKQEMEEQSKALLSREEGEVSNLKVQLTKSEENYASILSAKASQIVQADQLKQLTQQHSRGDCRNLHPAKVDQLMTHKRSWNTYTAMHQREHNSWSS